MPPTEYKPIFPSSDLQLEIGCSVQLVLNFPQRHLVLSSHLPLWATVLAMAEPEMALVAGGAGNHQLMVEMGIQDSTWKSVRHLTSNPLHSS